MDTTVNQTRLCSKVLLLILFYTLIFNSSAASTKDSEIEESLVSSTGRPKMVIGSRPPTCFLRCENCTPCKPIVVPLPPVLTQTDSASEHSEPKPEVWKCMCDGKLYNL
ncbi:EPIDERMAL PATTERNING FACTOR-like protein [Vigna angularis]|uniref:Epidermal patterning factor-like protein n=1 Tax=Phaseolus angularis TaxID=3914 RepID=A0A8T0KCQ4_PHAAN|nr:EPIDERMAL PATTERNING FACTOR-like protein [Vigna angularis]